MRAVERHLERLVARLVGASNDRSSQNTMKRSRRAGDQVDDVGQVDQVALVDLDQAQALARAYLLSSALTSDDLPVPRAPVSSTLLAG